MPPFLRNTGRGWVTAEYGMLPRSTHTRTDREAARGRQSGRTQEIQRLIGRSLRAVTDLARARRAADPHRLRRDRRPMAAPAPRRSPAAMSRSTRRCAKLVAAGAAAGVPLTDSVAAISCGVFDGVAVLDLDYAEDSQAETDANFVLTGSGGIVEIQATAEGAPFDETAFAEMLRAGAAIASIGRADAGISAPRLRPARHGAQWRGQCRRLNARSTTAAVIASHNPGKVVEIAELLAPYRASRRSAPRRSACPSPRRPATPSRPTPR